MGRELLARYPSYRHSLLEAGIYLKDLGCEWDLLSELREDRELTMCLNVFKYR